MPNRSELFFDIETTGLGVWKSHITVIGCGYINNAGELEVRQFFVEKPSLEKEVLDSFCRFSVDFDTIVHFNGNSFDIPYVRKKLEFYSLPDIFEGKRSKDLYTEAKPLKKLLSLPDLKQKSLETRLGIKRTDTISGFECIGCYRKYLETGDISFIDKLMLHNLEDIKGLYTVSGIRSFSCIINGGYKINLYEETPDRISIYMGLNSILPSEIVLSDDIYSLSAADQSAVISIKKEYKTLKYYFENWKDYYFLPDEGRSVHRSVGCYVDREFRKKATKETAYEPADGVFIHQPEKIIEPAFYDDYKGNAYFKAGTPLTKEQLLPLAEAVIKHLLK